MWFETMHSYLTGVMRAATPIGFLINIISFVGAGLSITSPCTIKLFHDFKSEQFPYMDPPGFLRVPLNETVPVSNFPC
jgi:hypothetical protein